MKKFFVSIAGTVADFLLRQLRDQLIGNDIIMGIRRPVRRRGAK